MSTFFIYNLFIVLEMLICFNVVFLNVEFLLEYDVQSSNTMYMAICKLIRIFYALHKTKEVTKNKQYTNSFIT